MNIARNLLVTLCLLTTLTCFTARSVIAESETEVELRDDSSPLVEEKISSGLVTVSIDYQPLDRERETFLEHGNLQYRIFYNESEKVNVETITFNSGNISLRDLDNNGTAEAIVKTFSGGAHCCTNILIYSWSGDRFVTTELGELDGDGGNFKDLDGDGKWELVTVDHAFLYQFSSYAGSFPPSLILGFNNGDLQDLTRQYSRAIASRAKQMYRTFLANKKNNLEINGILAGYVAQQALLGKEKEREAWDFMLSNYDRNSQWGLEIYEGDRQVGQYPNFPTALREFLLKNGYLRALERK
jgi:hypothetical protein